MNVTVVYNPKSGTALSKPELRTLFEAAGIGVDAYIDITTQSKHIKQQAKAGTVIAAIGGDGTIGSTARIVAGTEAVLAPLPGGTLNHFTKDLGVTQNLADAIAQLPKAKTHLIDIATVNDIIFINNSSIGLYPSSLQVRERLQKWIGKWPAAAVGAIESFIKYRTYTVTIDGRTIMTPFIFVGNNDYHLGRITEGRNTLDEGVLSVYIATCKNRWALLGLIGYAAIGKLYAHQAFHRQKSTHFTIQTRKKRLRVSHDGEVSLLDTPLEYAIIKQKLRVLK